MARLADPLALGRLPAVLEATHHQQPLRKAMATASTMTMWRSQDRCVCRVCVL